MRRALPGGGCTADVRGARSASRALAGTCLALGLALGIPTPALAGPTPSPAPPATASSPSPTPSPTPSQTPAPALSPTASPTAAASPPATDNSNRIYTLDGWGGLHPAGAAPAVIAGAYWKDWDIARGLAEFAAGTGGYVLDGWGGLHPFSIGGSLAPAPEVSGYWPGWDIARGIALAPWASPSNPAGYTLDGWGGVHPFGGAPPVGPVAYWRGWDIARGIVLLPDSTPTAVGGFTLDGWGGVHPFGTALPVGPVASWPRWDIAKGLALLPTSTRTNPAGYTLDGWGGVHPFGGAPAVRLEGYWRGWNIARGLTMWTGATAARPGGWVLDGWGGLHPFGSAPMLEAGARWPHFDIARGAAGSGGGSGTAPPPPPGGFGLAFVGASVTHGWYARTPSLAFAQRVVQMVSARRRQVKARVLAIPGARVADALNWELPSGQSGLVSHLSSNDFTSGTAIDSFRASLTILMRRLRTLNPRARLVCLGVWGSGRNWRGIDAAAYDAATAEICGGVGGRFVGLRSIYAKPAYHRPHRHTFLGLSDWYHPDDEGHLVIAQAVMNAIL